MSNRFYVATRKGLFTIDRGAHGWSISQASFLGDNCPMMMHDPRDGTLYAALSHGHFGDKLHRSTDGGATWTECAVPEYPEPPDGVESTPNAMGQVVQWKLKLVWELVPGGPDEPGVIWCGTAPGGLFKSTDGGESWTLNRPLWDDPGREQWFGGGFDYPGVHSLCVDPRDSKRIAAGVSCGGVWLTTDGGRSWHVSAKGMRAEYMPPEQAYDEGIQDPHRLVQCREHPDAYWVQHHNGIFRSADGCASWEEITDVAPSVFGFAVVVHPSDPDTAWFVPAIKDEKRIPVDGRVVVTRTTDGGQTFRQLFHGLPQEHAYDLVFRHALDIDGTGDRLAFGSTTGSLWVTEDGGDSWDRVSAHLPPIYAVRFAP